MAEKRISPNNDCFVCIKKLRPEKRNTDQLSFNEKAAGQKSIIISKANN